MNKIERLAVALLLALAAQLLRQLDDWAGVRNAVSDLQLAVWEARDAS